MGWKLAEVWFFILSHGQLFLNGTCGYVYNYRSHQLDTHIDEFANLLKWTNIRLYYNQRMDV